MYSPRRGFGFFASTARLCTGFEEQRPFSRAATRSGEPFSTAERRHRFQDCQATFIVPVP